MIRNGLVRDFPDWFYQMLFSDTTYFMLAARHGTIGYIDEVMAAYRKHHEGMWTGRSLVEQRLQLLRFYCVIYSKLGPEHDPIVSRMISLSKFGLAEAYRLNNQIEMASRTMEEVGEELPMNSDALLERTLQRARRIEKTSDGVVAKEFIDWICNAVGDHAPAQAWVRALRGEWYSMHAFEAHVSGDRGAAFRAVLSAFRHSPRLVQNRGLWSVLLSAMAGSQNPSARPLG